MRQVRTKLLFSHLLSTIQLIYSVCDLIYFKTSIFIFTPKGINVIYEILSPENCPSLPTFYHYKINDLSVNIEVIRPTH